MMDSSLMVDGDDAAPSGRYASCMRKAFPGFYVKKDAAFFTAIWNEGRFVFDANMLLNFFRYSAQTT
jgi:hypothetical protein